MGIPADTMLAPHFRAREFATSSSRPDLVTPPDEWTDHEVDHIAAMAAWMSRARGILGGPLVITSGLRREPLNRAIGGSVRSWHLDGRAVDWRPPRGMTSIEVLLALWDEGVVVDDLIAYHPSRGGHLHVQLDGSLTPRGRYRVRRADGRYVQMRSRDDIEREIVAWQGAA